MSGPEVFAYMLTSMVIGVVYMAPAMLLALVLVAAYRRGGSRSLWIVAAAMSLLIASWTGLHDSLNEDWPEVLTHGWITILPPLATAGALAGGLGGASFWRQTLGAGSVGILTAALPFMAAGVVLGEWYIRLLAGAALALTCYLVFRHLRHFAAR